MSPVALTTICRCAIASALFLIATAWPPATFAADGCPDSASEISTDRPDVTNSSRVVPYGSLQAKNGVDWTGEQVLTWRVISRSTGSVSTTSACSDNPRMIRVVDSEPLLSNGAGTAAARFA